jgi:mRNA interferase ChpB
VTPKRGDIVHLKFDPASGTEMRGDHFCLIVSPRAFNARFKLAWVCPISGGLAGVARDAGFLVSLMGYGLRTDGHVHVHQLKSLDWRSRQATFVETVPEALLTQVLDGLVAVLENGEP